MRLSDSRRALLVYLKEHLLPMEDWHGVMDAAADLREVDAKLKILKEQDDG